MKVKGRHGSEGANGNVPGAEKERRREREKGRGRGRKKHRHAPRRESATAF